MDFFQEVGGLRCLFVLKKKELLLKNAFALPLPISIHGNQTSGAILCLKFEIYFRAKNKQTKKKTKTKTTFKNFVTLCLI